MVTERHVVDNRVFLLGLDHFYREAMKPHERDELLRCAQQTAAALQVKPADVPIEGYYTEDALLTEYFRLMRALQQVDGGAAPQVSRLKAYQRLVEVASAPLYGRPVDNGKLLPAGRDALSQALLDTFPEWTVAGLTEAAYRAALEADDFSLVGLAARAKDAAVLAALRESVVLYAEVMVGGMPAKVEYEWAVDPALARQAGRFIAAFKSLFGETLPAAEPHNAGRYWSAHHDNSIPGRCVRLGVDDSTRPVRHYHWGICRSVENTMTVQAFWKPDVWTTERYRATLRSGYRCPEP
jgi:hypothetical protein